MTKNFLIIFIIPVLLNLSCSDSNDRHFQNPTGVDPADSIGPEITVFSLTCSNPSITCNINFILSGNDNKAIIGWIVKEDPHVPDIYDPAWTSMPPTSYILSDGYGNKSVYAWAKDADGNISAPESITISYVDGSAPAITDFTLTSSNPTSNSTIEFTLDGNDNEGPNSYGVYEWLINESASVPALNDLCWASIKPTTYNMSPGFGTKTVYAWAKDAADNISPSKSVMISYIAPPTPWYDPNWPFRQKITIDSGLTDSNLTDFSYLLRIDDISNKVFTNALSNGNDIIFTASDGITLLKHEIERYDSTNGLFEVWVRIPNLSSVTDTVFYMYYGNSGIVSPTEIPTEVWDSNYVLIYHLNNEFKDSTGTSDATNINSSNTQGAIGDARVFNGTNQYIDTNWGNGVGEDLLNWTFSAWVRADNLPDAFGDEGIIHMAVNGFISWGHVTPNNRGAVSIKTTGGGWQAASFAIGPNDIGKWIYLVGTFQSGSLRSYKDGSLISENTAATGNAEIYNVVNIMIGRHAYTTTVNNFFPGSIDEVRISSIVRSPDWIKADYRNQSDPENYQMLGLEESYN